MPTMYDVCQKCAHMHERGGICGACASMRERAPAPAVREASPAAPPLRQVPPSPAPGPASHPASSAPPRAVTAPQEVHALTFHGRGSSFLGIHIVNLLLTMLTLGVYYFWGKVKVRHYLYGQSEFNGDRFAYHGTGKELLFGFLRAALAFGGISLIFKASPLLPGGMAVRVGAGLGAYCLLFVLLPFAIVATRRYRMSRTSWRGIRFSFRGTVGEFTRLYLKGVALTIVTFGLYLPHFVARQQHYLVPHTYFGTVRFGFDGNGRELKKIYLPWVLMLVSLPFVMGIVLGFMMAAMKANGSTPPHATAVIPFFILGFYLLAGIYWFWFQAARQRYLWSHTTIGDARFHATMTGGRLLMLKLGNLLLLILTLGLAWPWTMVRSINFTFQHLSLEGAVDLASVQQDARSATAIGEGLDTLMDVDIGFAA